MAVELERAEPGAEDDPASDEEDVEPDEQEVTRTLYPFRSLQFTSGTGTGTGMKPARVRP
jgi:hypothetical protein